MDMNIGSCQSDEPEVQKKVFKINESLHLNMKIINENYSIIKEINMYLFAGEHTLLNKEDKKPDVSTGWFDKIIENLRVINCRNADIKIQLEKLQKEVITK